MTMFRENCDRCNKPTNGKTIMSMYNEQVICNECKDKERKREDYDKASQADNDEIKKGNFNFKGIGLDDVVGNKEFNQICDKMFGGKPSIEEIAKEAEEMFPKTLKKLDD